jgi:uncharacterized protein YrzB (UPF0473 family)
MENETFLLTDDEGNELECEYLDSIDYQGKEYVILYPLDQDADEGEVIIMEVVAIDEENEEFLTVDDEDLLDAIFEEYMRIVELEEQ